MASARARLGASIACALAATLLPTAVAPASAAPVVVAAPVAATVAAATPVPTSDRAVPTSRSARVVLSRVALRNPVLRGRAVIQAAKRLKGIRYVAGGTTPNSGFDCSGYTKYVFSRLGITHPARLARPAPLGDQAAPLAGRPRRPGLLPPRRPRLPRGDLRRRQPRLALALPGQARDARADLGLVGLLRPRPRPLTPAARTATPWPRALASRACPTGAPTLDGQLARRRRPARPALGVRLPHREVVDALIDPRGHLFQRLEYVGDSILDAVVLQALVACSRGPSRRCGSSASSSRRWSPTTRSAG